MLPYRTRRQVSSRVRRSPFDSRQTFQTLLFVLPRTYVPLTSSGSWLMVFRSYGADVGRGLANEQRWLVLARESGARRGMISDQRRTAPFLIFFWKHFRQNRKLKSVHKTVYLSLGSNLGDRAENLQTAIAKLGEFGTVVAMSSFYETEPVEVTAQPWFLNCAVKLDTEKMPKLLLKGILDLEREMGRRRTQNKGPRNIDIDILLLGNSIVEAKGLTIPHPALH